MESELKSKTWDYIDNHENPNNKNYSEMINEDREYAAKASSTKAVAKTKPKASAEPKALAKYNKSLKMWKYYKIKKSLAGSDKKVAGLTWNSSDQSMLDKWYKKMIRAKKAAAPLLIQRQRQKRASRGRGKRRGSDLARLK